MLPLFQDVWRLMEAQVFPVASTPLAFNQYSDLQVDLDLPDAPARRRENLHNYFDAYRERPQVFILAEAPGPWGCRFSGIPITSEAQLLEPTFPISGSRTSLRSHPYDEYSARIYWRVLLPVFPQFFTWNSVPYHPHKRDRPLSIRTPGAREIAAQASALSQMIAILQPSRLIAVGRKAELAFKLLGRECTYVRHPSQGGSNIFEAGMRSIFDH